MYVLCMFTGVGPFGLTCNCVGRTVIKFKYLFLLLTFEAGYLIKQRSLHKGYTDSLTGSRETAYLLLLPSTWGHKGMPSCLHYCVAAGNVFYLNTGHAYVAGFPYAKISLRYFFLVFYLCGLGFQACKWIQISVLIDSPNTWMNTYISC